MQTTQPTGVDDGAVILGVLPTDTPRTRVAGSRPGFIAPTATAGGDAPPITHPTRTAIPGLMASTGIQRQPAPHSFAAGNRTATAAVAVMTTVVLALTTTATTAVVAGPVDWQIVAWIVTGGFLGLGSLSLVPALRWANRILGWRDGQIGAADQ